ncbi:MAG: monovalent cation/H+ antiporter subunit D family protein [Proteobacteria bacterium]|jgi:multicomponent Na+:H+ antiporter subunit D|nr:monovalent cation/H+ antiporter subunit D family protein [Desulfocapsa sp.]MBU3945791.1 monovalent cation/H+ antiporter subunit D family protein [Pseudomonadota bacterium]MCG2745437.1 monovalent cation/H+ antiporter subunit D family protein [Desulfobacteraceae bacterium]MBU3983576.1 monovalent cation/H+ antiporter subunit D family protein [Pseudomonadota bacterium]MBU4030083.1 monovalent cation/H+ antiporter subunit D family protein [Pseudomonadota bacterium]
MDITTVSSAKLLVALLVPLVGTLGVMFMGKNENIREGVSCVASIILFLLVASMIPTVLSGKTMIFHMFSILPGVTVTLRADAMSMIFALVASSLWTIAVFYSMGYMRAHNEHAQTRFNACFALSIFGAIGVAFSDNLFTLYLFYEIVSICTYPLVAHHQDAEGYNGARKYIVYLTTTAKAFLLPALILIYVLTGTLDFATNISTGIFPPDVNHGLVIMLYVFCLFGFAKNGIMPFHHWLPGAMVAPTPVSALLHAVAVVKVGVFCTTRVMLYVFGVDTMHALNLGIPTAYFVGFTVIMASVLALSKNNLKERLAYSTISQLSYIIMGVALLTPAGIDGGLIHIVNHAFAKITLFFCAGAIYIAAHKKDISDMGGLGKTMPFTFGAFAIASLSMIGAPPVAGFVTKWNLLVGSIQAHQMGILLILIASTMLNVGYFAPVTIKAFFGKRPEGETFQGIKEAPLSMLIPILIACTISVLLGIFPNFMMQFVKAVTG